VLKGKNPLFYRHVIGIMGVFANADKVPVKFDPSYVITPNVMNALMRIDAAKQKILHLPFQNQYNAGPPFSQ
jgi:hypothetical protein